MQPIAPFCLWGESLVRSLARMSCGALDQASQSQSLAGRLAGGLYAWVAPSRADAQPPTHLPPQQLEAAYSASCRCRPHRAMRKFTSLPFNETECGGECSGRASFSNKADVHALLRLTAELFGADPMCRCATVLVGGLNRGDIANLFLQACPTLSLHAFEVQKWLIKSQNRSYGPGSAHPNARLHNLGLGRDRSWFNVSRVANAHEGAGLWERSTMRGSRKLTTVQTVPLLDFAREQRIEQVQYAAIDVEGFEPWVFEGMRLATDDGRRMFPAFQWEAADAWTDRRRPAGTLDRREQLAALRSYGYESYIIGTTKPCGVYQHSSLPLSTDRSCTAAPTYLGPLDESFFRADAPWWASFEGNVLSLHRQYAPPRLWRWVQAHRAASS